MIKVAFSFKSQRTEKIELSSQGTDGPINPRYKSLITINCEYEETLPFAFLDKKLWLKRGKDLILTFIQIHSFDVRKS